MANTPEKQPRLNTQMEDALKANGITPEPVPEAARLEAEEQKEIDAAIDQMRSEGGAASEALQAKSDLNESVKSKSASRIPVELERAYGGTPPAAMVAEYTKLPKSTSEERNARKEYLIRTASRSGGEKKNEAQAIDRMRNEGGVAPDLAPPIESQGKEKPFDPHSVQSMVSPEEQKNNLEMRGYLAKDGLIPPQSVQDRDVDIREAQAPQYGQPAAPPRTKKARPAAKTERKTERKKGGTRKSPARKKDAEQPAEQPAASPDRWGGYPQKYSELLKLLKNTYGREVPPELVERVQVINQKYLRERSKKEFDQGTLAGYAAELQSVIEKEKLQSAPMKQSSIETPIATAEAHPLEESESVELKDATPSEARSKLRQVVGKLTALAGKKERTATPMPEESWQKQAEMLKQRSAELDTEAAKMGRVEKLFRALGEGYSKLGWKSKLAVGVGLGIGAGVSAAAVSLPAIMAFTFGIAAQRTAGLASMYLRFEKTSASKERAMMKAMLYTAGMTAGIAYAVREISETEIAQKTAEWLKEHYPFTGGEAKVHSPQMPGTTYSPEAEQVMHPAPAVATSVPEAPSASEAVPAHTGVAAPEMPSVEASAGHGYDYMAKRLWEQLQEKHLDPNAFPEGSDVRTLLNADDKSIDSVVHRLALSHAMVGADGASSAIISPDAHMTIGADGRLEFEGVLKAPEPEVSFTPEGHMPDAATELTAAQQVEAPAGVPSVEGTVETPAIAGAPAENLVSEPAAESMPTIDVTAPPAEPPPVSPDIAGMRTIDVPPPTEAPMNPADIPEYGSHPSVEVPVVPVEQSADVVTNQFGVSIPLAEPHIYADQGGEHLFAYGGVPEQRANFIAEYLAKNPDSTVFSTDDSGKYRIPWHLVDGKPMPGEPVRTPGFFGFLTDWMNPPGPEEFEKLVK